MATLEKNIHSIYTPLVCPTCGSIGRRNDEEVDGKWIMLEEGLLVYKQETVATFTRLETKPLLLLARHYPNFVNKENIYNYCYENVREPPDIKIVDVMICHIRKKLKNTPFRIITFWGRGYKLEVNENYVVNS